MVTSNVTEAYEQYKAQREETPEVIRLSVPIIKAVSYTQLDVYKRQVPAFKDLVVYRPGYAIEYDYFEPTKLKHTLESKIIKNLFLSLIHIF